MLDTFKARQKFPLVPNSRFIKPCLQIADSLGTEAADVSSVNVNELDVFGAGLQNKIGEYNCFLTVIIQVSAHCSSLDTAVSNFCLIFLLNFDSPCGIYGNFGKSF